MRAGGEFAAIWRAMSVAKASISARGDDVVHEADAKGFLGLHDAGGEEQLLRKRRAHDAGKLRAANDEPVRGAGEAERGVVGGDADVAEDGDERATAVAEAVHGGDEGLPEVRDGAVRAGHALAAALPVDGGDGLGHVGAGAEGGACAREDRAMDVGVGVEGGERVGDGSCRGRG